MKKIILPVLDSDLLKECHVTACRASGSGGQHVNVTDSAVRLCHLPTGIVVTSQKERSQLQNKRECLKKLRQIVEKKNYRPPKRIATKMPRSVKCANREKKAIHSKKKQLRRKPTRLDDQE